MDKISIIIPIYNSEKYIKDCLDSVINQTYTNIEIIIVDDGSTDSSPAIIQSYQQIDARIKAIHQINSGSMIARINGINNSTGDYITFVDSDDYVEKIFIEKLYSATVNTNADITVCDYFLFSNNNISKKNEVNTYFTLTNNKSNNCCSILKKFSPCLWNKMFKKTLLDKFLGFTSSNLTIAEDVCFVFFAFATANTITFIPSNLYYYRNVPTSISNTFTDYWHDYSIFFESVLYFNEKNKLNLEHIIHDCFGTYYIVKSLKQAFKTNNKTEINKIINSNYVNLFCKNYKPTKITTKVFIFLLKTKNTFLLKNAINFINN